MTEPHLDTEHRHCYRVRTRLNLERVRAQLHAVVDHLAAEQPEHLPDDDRAALAGEVARATAPILGLLAAALGLAGPDTTVHGAHADRLATALDALRDSESLRRLTRDLDPLDVDADLAWLARHDQEEDQ